MSFKYKKWVSFKFLDKPYLKDINITPVIKHYKVFSEIDEVAQKHEADLIVMGSHGTDGLQEIFIGSNCILKDSVSIVPWNIKHKKTKDQPKPAK